MCAELESCFIQQICAYLIVHCARSVKALTKLCSVTVTLRLIVRRDEDITPTSHLQKVHLSLPDVDRKLESVDRN